jgi:protein TonB
VQAAPAAITAPATIPQTAVPVGDGGGAATADGGAAAGPWGDPSGSPDGVDIGQPSSTAAVGVPEITYAPGGEVKSAAVLQRVEPQYPRAALAARMGGVVVLRCVIGKDGEVRDAAVVSSTFAPFDQPALEALRHWRFAAGSLHGRPVDTWFELTIRFAAR